MKDWLNEIEVIPRENNTNSIHIFRMKTFLLYLYYHQIKLIFPVLSIYCGPIQLFHSLSFAQFTIIIFVKNFDSSHHNWILFFYKNFKCVKVLSQRWNEQSQNRNRIVSKLYSAMKFYVSHVLLFIISKYFVRFALLSYNYDMKRLSGQTTTSVAHNCCWIVFSLLFFPKKYKQFVQHMGSLYGGIWCLICIWSCVQLILIQSGK